MQKIQYRPTPTLPVRFAMIRYQSSSLNVDYELPAVIFTEVNIHNVLIYVTGAATVH